MQKTEIKNLFSAAADYMDSQVTVCGWVKTRRQSKTLAFIELNDGTCFKNLQVVLEEGKLPNYQEIVKQNVGAALIVEGHILLTPNAKQPFELHASSIQV